VVSGHAVNAAARQLDTLRALGVEVRRAGPPGRVDLVIDAMVGYSLQCDPRGTVASSIEWTSSQTAPVLSLDVPSGFNASDGTLRTPHVTAEATLTLAAPKRGLDLCGAAGEIYVGDISVPRRVYERIAGQPAPVFGADWVVRAVVDDVGPTESESGSDHARARTASSMPR
jgi:NAD(P)H-hydrate epimerase